MIENSSKTRPSIELPISDNGQGHPLSDQAAARSILSYALERVLPESALKRYVSMDETSHVLTVAGKEYNFNEY